MFWNRRKKEEPTVNTDGIKQAVEISLSAQVEAKQLKNTAEQQLIKATAVQKESKETSNELKRIREENHLAERFIFSITGEVRKDNDE